MTTSLSMKERMLPKLPIDFRSRFGPWAIITGASSGMGAEFARQLSIFGFSLVLVARRKELLDSLASMLIKKYAIQVKVLAVDLAMEDGWRSVVSETEELDVGLLINSAGVEIHGSFFKDPVECHINLISVNVTASSALAHEIGRRLAEKQKGGIIFVSSVSSRPHPWWASYSSSKSFVTCMGLALRNELKSKGVTVSVLEPAAVHSKVSAWKKEVDNKKIISGQTLVHECVSSALTAVARNCPRTTPGFRNSLRFRVTGALPTSINTKAIGSSVKKALSPEMLNNA